MMGDDAEEGLVPVPDLSCDDIFIGTPHQQIQAAIQREIGKEEYKDMLAKGLLVNSGSMTLTMRANVPSAVKLAADKQLARASLFSLREKFEAKEQGAVKTRKAVNYLTPNMQVVDGPFEPIDFDEVVIALTIYHHKKQAKIQEFLVLGSQKLIALRDKIKCVSDLLPEPRSRSGYFFFENVFYDDLRYPDNICYSKTVIDWANAKREEELRQPMRDDARTPDEASAFQQQYTAAKMEDTVWEDLKVRIGVPYLFCHQGNCEHRVIINDIRLATKEDERNKNAYPLQTFQSKIRRKKCTICDIYPASYLTYNDELSPQNPCFFCEKCYAPFHYAYDSRGTLLLNHDVFKYHHE